MDNYNKIQNTLVEMVTDREYSIDKIYEYSGEEDYFIPMLISSNSLDKKLIIFITYKKMGKKDVLKFLDQIKESEYNHAILISKIELTSQAKKSLQIYEEENIFVEIFLHKQVLFNVTKHCLQPKFSLMKNSEIKKICEELQCSLSDIPKISINDPIARYYNAKSKNVFKIMRRDNIYFRIVI
jgi:DNA-directed RNA polymerase I, II, and III subunit RPABC1